MNDRDSQERRWDELLSTGDLCRVRCGLFRSDDRLKIRAIRHPPSLRRADHTVTRDSTLLRIRSMRVMFQQLILSDHSMQSPSVAG